MCATQTNAFAPTSSLSIQSKSQINQSTTSSSSSSASSSTTTSIYMSDAANQQNPFDFFSNLLQPKKEVEEQKPKIPDVVIDPDYKIAVAFAVVGGLIFAATGGSAYGYFQGGITELFALLLFVQAGRVRFVFDETAFELKIGGGDVDDELSSSGENIVVGGENRWTYDSFVNYDFFPRRGLPILVYFKEKQTPQEMWNEGPGGLDKVGGGQVHFFPAFCNVDQLKEQFALRGCAKIEE